MGIASDLSEIKEVSDTIVANKVSKFCYTDTAYENNDANGVSVYNVNNEQNIPTSSPTVMKVNDTVVTKGWRARASSITRMFMNHMLGRLSYNVNKLSDMMNSLLAKLSASLDTNGGLATVNAQGKVSLLNNVVNTGDSATPTENGTDKFTTGGAYGLQQAVLSKAPVSHASSTTEYGEATDSLYGHVMKTLGGISFQTDTDHVGVINGIDFYVFFNNSDTDYSVPFGRAENVAMVTSTNSGTTGLLYHVNTPEPVQTAVIPAKSCVFMFFVRSSGITRGASGHLAN